ncbi:MAG: GerMN domain-containing protein [Firmicutes bacterium]|nr:GerMN domain-containing protein [Bacillota bacterium]
MKKILYIILFFILFAVLIKFLVSCEDRANQPAQDEVAPQRTVLLEDTDMTSVTVYFASEDKRYLVPVNVNINATKEVAKVALEKLLAGPTAPGLSPVLPQETKLLDVYGLGQTVVVDFTDEFTSIPEEDAALAIDAVLATVLPLADEYTLTIMVRDYVLDDFYGLTEDMPFGEIYVNPVEDIPADDGSRAAVYYLPEQNGMYLTPLTFFLPNDSGAEAAGDQDAAVYAALQTARAVADKLTAGPPKGSSLLSVFSPGLRVLDMDLNEGILYVDFSKEILDYGGGASLENMLVDSIVYSFCAIDGIDAVQILVEGETMDYFPEGREAGAPIAPQHPVNSII